MTTLGLILGGIFIMLFVLFLHEIATAPIVDGKASFLNGDYDPLKDETLVHEETFCKHCKFYNENVSSESCCLAKGNIGRIGDDRVKYCKTNSLFEAE